jgi:hypothetical protein
MRVSNDTTDRLREGKRALRASRRGLPLPEKVRQVVELQKVAVEIAKGRKTITGRERVWKLDR